MAFGGSGGGGGQGGLMDFEEAALREMAPFALHCEEKAVAGRERTFFC